MVASGARGMFAWGAVAALLGAALFIGWFSTAPRPLRDGIDRLKASAPAASSSGPSGKPPPAKKKRPTKP